MLGAILALLLLVATAAPAGAVRPGDDLLPAPGRQPVGHRAQSLGHPVGTIRIPAIGLEDTIRAGVDMAIIDQGVAHWAGTQVPGGEGNVVLAGHRTTHSKPFADLDLLDEGDMVYLTNGAGFEVMYRVSESFIVAPNDIWITYGTDVPTVTMFACHPKGSARYRIVVRATIVGGGIIS
jgi:LPXTG-site transpeptidase (sortase) family protein